ncbi:MAG: PAS domain S-box protein [Pedobacter sp.]|nr:PAS domain S-box protein [Pedobacter sp.]
MSIKKLRPLMEWGKNWHEIFQLSPRPMWVYHLDTLKFIDVNQAALVHYGYSYEEFLALTIFELSLKEDIDLFKFAVPLIKTFKRNDANEIYRHLKKNGEVIQVKIGSNLITTTQGKAVLITVTDVTAIVRSEQELKESREELQKSENRFKALVQEGSDLIAVIDSEGYYTFVSESFKPLLGFLPSDFIGKCAFDFVHPDDRDRVQATILTVRQIKRVTFEPFRFINSNNEWRWIATTATDLTDDSAVGGIVTNSNDITESIIKRDQLRLSNERYRLALKAADEAICDWDIEHDTTDWGSGFYEIFGYDLAIYSNTIWSDNIYPEDRAGVLEEMQRVIADPHRDILYSECRFIKANGEVINLQFRMLFLRNEQGKALRAVASFRDITAIKQTLYQVQSQNERLKDIAWAQSHTVRAPLARIMGLIELLKTEGSPCNYQNELMEYLCVSAAELDEVIKEIVRKTEALKIK